MCKRLIIIKAMGNSSNVKALALNYDTGVSYFSVDDFLNNCI